MKIKTWNVSGCSESKTLWFAEKSHVYIKGIGTFWHDHVLFWLFNRMSFEVCGNAGTKTCKLSSKLFISCLCMSLDKFASFQADNFGNYKLYKYNVRVKTNKFFLDKSEESWVEKLWKVSLFTFNSNITYSYNSLQCLGITVTTVRVAVNNWIGT